MLQHNKISIKHKLIYIIVAIFYLYNLYNEISSSLVQCNVNFKIKEKKKIKETLYSIYICIGTIVIHRKKINPIKKQNTKQNRLINFENSMKTKIKKKGYKNILHVFGS